MNENIKQTHTHVSASRRTQTHTDASSRNQTHVNATKKSNNKTRSKYAGTQQ